MNFIGIIPIALLILIGYLFLNIFNLSNEEKWGNSYLIGTGLFTFLLFISYLFGLSFFYYQTTIIYLIIFIVIVALNLRLKKKFCIPKINFYLIPLFILFASTIFSGFYWPITSWDSISLYDYRSQLMLKSGSLESLSSLGYDLGYPMLTSIGQYWLYIFGSNTGMPLHAFFYVFFCLASFAFFKRILKGNYIYLFTYFLALSHNLFLHSRIAYTNLPYTAFITLSVAYLYLYQKSSRISDLQLSAIYIGLTTWTRTYEPFWVILLGMAILFSLLKKKLVPIIIYLATFFSIQLPWKYYYSLRLNTTSNPVGEVISNISTVNSLSKDNSGLIIIVLVYLKEVIFDYYKFFIFIALLALLSTLNKRFKIENLIYPMFLIGSVVMLIGGTYIMANSTDYWNQIPSSTRRMMLFLPTISIFYLSTTIRD